MIREENERFPMPSDLRLGLFATGFLLGACVEPPAEDPVSTAETFEAFVRQHAEWNEEEQIYAVDGDLAFRDLEGLRALFDAQRREGALTSFFFDGPNDLPVRYCVDTVSFGAQHAEVVAWLALAERDWEDAANIDLQHNAAADGDCSIGDGIEPERGIDVVITRNDTLAASSRFVFEDWLVYPRERIELNVDRARAGFDGRGPVGVLMHALGHALGYAHERNPALSTCEGTAYPVWDNSGPFDGESIMVAGYGCGVSPSQRLSNRDRMKVIAMHGPNRRVDPRVKVFRWRHFATNSWITLVDDEISDQTMQANGYGQKTFQFYASHRAGPNNVLVYRWWHAATGDWVTITENWASDEQMAAWGYSQKTPQFYANTLSGPTSVPVHRWYYPANGDWVTVANEATDAQMAAWGYTNKTFLFFAPNSREGVVPVYRWWHPTYQDYITVRENETTDAHMASLGWTDKHFQFLATTTWFPGSRAFYRWYHPTQVDWVNTNGLGGPTDADMTSWGYTGKTFLFYVSASAIDYETTEINRWHHTGSLDWVTVSSYEKPDPVMTREGYTMPTFLGHGFL